jgi:uncharacterized membrane protein
MIGQILKTALQGAWLGHPLHAIAAHLPAGLFPAVLIFDLLSRTDIDGSGAMRLAGTWCVAVALLATLPAAVTGLADFLDIKREKPAWSVGLIHAALNGVVIVIAIVNLSLRLREPAAQVQVGTAVLVLSAVVAVVALASVWFGGRMVFHYGVSVARHNKDELRTAAVEAGAAVPGGEDD